MSRLSLLVVVLAVPAFAQAVDLHAELNSGAAAATAFNEATGVALTPLLGLTILGAARWYVTAPELRAALPFHQQPWFWGTGLALVLIFFFGHRVPVIDRAFKVFKTWENKASALLALPLVSLAVAKALSSQATVAVTHAWRWVVPTAYAADGHAATLDSAVATVAAFLAALAITSAIWLLGHAVNVLVLVSPWAPVDWALKGGKALIIVLLTAASAWSPKAGLVISALYALVALLLAGWTFRLMVFGTVFTNDLLWRRRAHAGDARCFSAAGLRGVKPRTWGWLRVDGDQLRFVWRPWVVLPKRSVPVVADAVVLERGVLGPVLAREAGGALVRFPPRYRGHEETLAHTLGMLTLRDAMVLRSFKAMRAWVFEQPAQTLSSLR